eukprot:2150090-Amphidinium_carterae.1
MGASPPTALLSLELTDDGRIALEGLAATVLDASGKNATSAAGLAASTSQAAKPMRKVYAKNILAVLFKQSVVAKFVADKTEVVSDQVLTTIFEAITEARRDVFDIASKAGPQPCLIERSCPESNA